MSFSQYKQIVLLSYPIILSQGVQTLLILIDRYILSFKNPMFTAASTTAGFAALSLSMFFVYFLSFSTVLIGKSFGKDDLNSCRRILTQCLCLSVLFSPIILLFSLFGGAYFKMLHHPQEFYLMELSYFRLIMLGYIPILFKTSLESYLIGIGKSKPILTSNVIGLITNSLLGYLFVLGPLSGGVDGIKGAALATIIANLLSTLFLFIRAPWNLYRESLFLNCKALLVQGSYTGIEKFMNSFCFVLFVNMLVIYGPEVSMAVSIVFTWDQIAFLPLMGIYSSLTSLYSQYLGKGLPFYADKILHSSLQLTLGLMLVFSIFFWNFSDLLIQGFTVKNIQQVDVALVRVIGAKLLKTTCFYILIQSFVFIYKAGLRSLGFSAWSFWSSLVVHLLLILSSYLGIYVFKVGYLQVWSYFMAMLVVLGGLFAFKFYKSRALAKRDTVIDFSS